MKSKVVFLSVILGLFFFGCNRQTPEEDDFDVVIFINAKSLSGSLLKSDVSEAENSIAALIIYGVDDAGNVMKFPVTQTPITNGSNIELKSTKNINTFYAIANPSPEIEAQTPSTVSALTEMLADFEFAPQSPFLMSGKAEKTGKFVNLELVRAVAKVEIFGLNDFEIQTVTVVNTPDRGYVFDGNGALPTDLIRINYPPINTASPNLYVAENLASTPTIFRVTGLFDGKNASYDVVLKVGEAVPILRNTHYLVSITPKTDDECTISVDIPGWKEKETDVHIIPDDKFQ